jgi:hypothetical protein
MVAITGGFSEGFVDLKMRVAGNAAATAATILADPGLIRVSVVSHLLDATFFMLTAMVLYFLLRHVHEGVARAMLVFVVLAAGIIALNAVFQFEALQVATDGTYTAAFGVAGSNAIVLLLLDIQHFGTLSAQVFFGLWLTPLAYLAYKSDLFPKALSVLLVAATVCYLADLLAAFLAPDIEATVKPAVFMGAIAEGWMVGYLLIKGVGAPSKPVGAPAALIPVGL